MRLARRVRGSNGCMYRCGCLVSCACSRSASILWAFRLCLQRFGDCASSKGKSGWFLRPAGAPNQLLYFCGRPSPFVPVEKHVGFVPKGKKHKKRFCRGYAQSAHVRTHVMRAENSSIFFGATPPAPARLVTKRCEQGGGSETYSCDLRPSSSSSFSLSLGLSSFVFCVCRFDCGPSAREKISRVALRKYPLVLAITPYVLQRQAC